MQRPKRPVCDRLRFLRRSPTLDREERPPTPDVRMWCAGRREEVRMGRRIRRSNRDCWNSRDMAMPDVYVRLDQSCPPPRPAPPPPPSHQEPLPGSSRDNSGDVVSRLLSVLECPVCFEYVSPPILQCREGHLVCSGCRARLDLCPKCRQPFADVRARALEQVVELVPYPCYNPGCGSMIPLSERASHEVVCPYRQYPCPVVSCGWQGPRPGLVSHIVQCHPPFILSASSHEVTLSVSNTFDEKYFVMNCFGEIFYCLFGSDGHEEVFLAIVMYVGPKEKAAEYEFELKLKRDTPPYSQFTYCRSTFEEMPLDGLHMSLLFSREHLLSYMSQVVRGHSMNPHTNGVVINYHTLRDMFEHDVPRGPVINVGLTIRERIKTQHGPVTVGGEETPRRPGSD